MQAAVNRCRLLIWYASRTKNLSVVMMNDGHTITSTKKMPFPYTFAFDAHEVHVAKFIESQVAIPAVVTVLKNSTGTREREREGRRERVYQ